MVTAEEDFDVEKGKSKRKTNAVESMKEVELEDCSSRIGQKERTVAYSPYVHNYGVVPGDSRNSSPDFGEYAERRRYFYNCRAVPKRRRETGTKLQR